jgi:hypothetical protein
MALDRDEDGELDSDERDAGTNPGNAGSVLGACNDGIDNDGDGNVDWNGGPLSEPADPGCASETANIENPECDDGFDNDNDGTADLFDAHCASASDNREKRVQQRRCGVGVELAILLPPVMWLYGRRRRSD